MNDTPNPGRPAAPTQPSIFGRLPIYYGWVVVMVAFTTMAIGVTIRTSFSLLYPPILAEFGWDRGVTAGIFSVGFLASMLMTPFFGAWINRWGPGSLFGVGAVLVSAGLILTTYADTPLPCCFSLWAWGGGRGGCCVTCLRRPFLSAALLVCAPARVGHRSGFSFPAWAWAQS